MRMSISGIKALFPEIQKYFDSLVSMTWAKRLKRVFNIEVETCHKYGADVRIIVSIA